MSEPGSRAHASLFILAALAVAGPIAARRAPADRQQSGEPEYPAAWQPTGLLDARLRRVGQTVDLYAAAGGVEVSVPQSLKCRVGFREEMPIILTRRGTANNRIRITGAGPPGVTCDPVDVEMRRKRTGRVTPAVQTLLPRPAYLVVTVAVGADSARIPVEILPSVTYPLLGLAIPAGVPQAIAHAERCAAQIVEPIVPPPQAPPTAEPDRVWEQTVREVRQRLRCQIQLNLGSASQSPQQARALVEQWAQQVDCWVLGEAGTRAFADIAALATGVAEADPEALVFTPAIRSDIRDERSPGYALYEALLQRGLPEHVTGIAFDARLPGPLAEAEEPAAWSDGDRAASLEPAVQLMAKHDANVPLWCTIVPAMSGEERLDALRAVRDAVIALSTGAASVLFAPPSGAGPTGHVPALASTALGAAATELAGARPVRVPPEEGDCSSALGSEVTYRVFRRGDEGIVWLWSNATRPRRLTLRLRHEPQGLRRLSFGGAAKDFIHRETDLLFLAQKDSKTRHFLVGVELAPLETAAYTFPFTLATDEWLAGVRRGAPPAPEKQERR